ncbi:MAG: methionine adenosyltransferase [Candidatus Nezhaarchaeota archaeon]|nr:methionine adenosyltransferase [Candidatus Nezhaarchaeota archaeon]
MQRLFIERLEQVPLEEQRIEIVERKGLGHPDYICDSIMNRASIELAKEYLERVGYIMHHNLDKGLLAAGEVEVRFGGGVVKRPMLLVFGDRATFRVDGEEIPVADIVVGAAKQWIKENLRFVDPTEHVRYQVEIKQGSEALTDIFKRRAKKVLGANDTSAAVGYAPLTRTEKLVLGLENFLNSKEFKERYPETGEDVKVMGFRKDDSVELTVAMAFVDRFISSEEEYFKRKEEVYEAIREFLEERSPFKKTIATLNSLDRRRRGIGGVYLTVLGTSADGADCGQVGRGNRVNGVIPLNRPVSSEAAAGKNPVSHVGKIYNVLAHRIAEKIYSKVPGISEVYVWLLSRIGEPVNKPRATVAQLIPERGVKLSELRGQVRDVVEEELGGIEKFCEDLAYGRVPVC